MNRRLLAGFMILVSLAVLVDRSHGWDQDPIAIIYPWYLFEKVGEDITFDASASHDPDNGYPYGGGHGIVCCYLWTWPPEAKGITEYGEGGDDFNIGWAKCYFDTPGIYYVYVEVEDDEGATGSDYAKAHAIRVTLDGGGYLALNDLAQISLSIEPPYPTLNTGEKVLRALDGGEKIRVWYDSQRQQECQLPASWGFDSRWEGGPSELWVEGIATSSSLEDVAVFELSYEYGGSKVDSDTTEFTVLDVDEVTICKPTGTDWIALPWDQVVLEGEPLRIKANITPSLPGGADFSIDVTTRTSYTNPTGITVTLNEIANGGSKLRGTSSTSSLMDSGGGGPEFTSADNASGSGSNFNDSDQFDSDMAAPHRTQRGKARNGGNENASPPEAGVSKTFMQAAGVEYIEVIYNEGEATEKKDKNQIENQADYLYYSGHGSHHTGGVNLYPSGSFLPSHVSGGNWESDLGMVFLVGCSVCDVDDLNGNYDDDGDGEEEVGPASKVFPGEKWATTGPNYFMGYNWYAPSDTHNGDPQFTAKIIHKWYSDTERTILDAWGYANRFYAGGISDSPYNACAIDSRWSSKTYWYWRAWKIGGVIYDRTWESYAF